GPRRRERDPADSARAGPADLPRAAHGTHLLARPAHGERMGARLLLGQLHCHRAHPQAAREDRARSSQPAPHPDRVGRRLPVQPMRRALATLTVAFLACAIVMLAVGGWSAVAKTAEIVLPVGALTVAVAAAGDAGK